MKRISKFIVWWHLLMLLWPVPLIALLWVPCGFDWETALQYWMMGAGSGVFSFWTSFLFIGGATR